MENIMTKLRVAAIALAGVLAVGATTTSASAQWRGHHHGGWGWGGPAVGIGAGIAAGALIGSAVAARPYGYYEPGYAYAQPYAVAPGYGYAQPYAYDAGPAYYGSYGYRNWGYGPCFTDEGYGRRSSCDASTR
jgi:hypothetical protein